MWLTTHRLLGFPCSLSGVGGNHIITSVHAIGFGTTYNSAMENAREISIEPPYVVSTFLDMQFVGVCASISFDALRTKLIEKGEMDEDAIDNKFFAMIGLKVNLISFK